jgi:hypothetical protein
MMVVMGEVQDLEQVMVMVVMVVILIITNTKTIMMIIELKELT